MGVTMATHLQHIVIRYGMAYAAELPITQVPARAEHRYSCSENCILAHETTYKTKGIMSTLLCIVETSLFI